MFKRLRKNNVSKQEKAEAAAAGSSSSSKNGRGTPSPASQAPKWTFRQLDRHELQELLNLDVQAIALDVQREAQIKYQKEKRRQGRMSLFRKKGEKAQVSVLDQDAKGDVETDMYVEETLEFVAGQSQSAAYYPGIDLKRVSGHDAVEASPSPNLAAADAEKLNDYEQITYDVFDGFVRHHFPNNGEKYQTLDDIDDNMREAAEKQIDALYNQVKE